MIISEEFKEFVASVGVEVLAATVTHDDIGTKLLKPGFGERQDDCQQ